VPWKEVKEERERRGLTISDISLTLKISKAYITAMERGDFGALPDPVFSRGFLRTYCRFLGVDEGKILSAYNESLEHEEKGQMNSLKAIPSVERKISPLGRFLLITSGVFAILFVVVAVMHIQVKREKAKFMEKEKLESSLPVIPKSGKDEISAEGKESSVPGVLQGKRFAPPPVVAKKKKKRKSGLELTIVAKELTWLYIVPDRGQPVDVTLYPGDELTIQGKERVRLKVGNAGGIDVSLNGKKLESLGSSGEVVEKTLTLWDTVPQ